MNEILSRLDVLAAKLGQTVVALWPHAVRHTAIEAAAGIGLTCLIAILGAALIIAGAVWAKNNKWEEGPWYGAIVVGGLIAVGSLFAAAHNGASTIAAALEPTGHTVKQILRGKN